MEYGSIGYMEYGSIWIVWFLLEPDDEKLSCPVPSEDESIRIYLSQ